MLCRFQERALPAHTLETPHQAPFVNSPLRRLSIRNRTILALLLAACLFGRPAFAAPPSGYYQVWADEFGGTSLDTSKWSAWSGPNRHAINTPSAATLGGGYLTITTYTTNGTHYSAILSTDGKFRYRYGYLEASIDFNTTPGMWSAYWLQSPTEGQYIGDPSASGAEIDICEHRASDATGSNIASFVQSTVHWDGYATDHKQVNGGNIGSGLGTGFHTYGLLWDSTNYFFLIDGVQQWATNIGHSDRTEIVLLSSEVQDAYWAGVVPAGGYGDFLTSTTKMIVDYVRYYAPTTTVFWTGASSANWSTAGNWLGEPGSHRRQRRGVLVPRHGQFQRLPGPEHRRRRPVDPGGRAHLNQQPYADR